MSPATSPAVFKLPPLAPGLRVGLFGGSFDPAHIGHVEVSLEALRQLRLDQVWWLVSPQNPLKTHAPSNELEQRIEGARRVAAHPRIQVTGVEAAFGTRTTAETLDRLLPRLRHVRPIWMMGIDNLGGFHRWHRWTSISARLPIAIFNRPGMMLPGLASLAAQRLSRGRIYPRNAGILPALSPPAWVILPSPHIAISSTELRRTIRLGEEVP